VARQLTLIECHLFKLIQPKECLNQAWSKASLRDLAPNILNLTDRFNQVSKWVGTEILQVSPLKERARVLRYFIDVAIECFEINCFNVVQEMVAALNSAAIHRLALTWAELDLKTRKRWKTITEAMAPDMAYKSPRELLARCTPPCVPFLCIFLSDLTFVEEGNPDNLEVEGAPTPLINFVKRRRVAEVIEKICDYHNVAYKFHPVPEIQRYLIEMRGWDDNKLYAESLLREPRKKT